MKVPLPCFRCKTFTMAMDMSKTHQHIECENCGATWCLLCTSVDIDPEWLTSIKLVRQNAAKAHLN